MQDPRRASYPGSQPMEPPSPAALLRLMRRRVPPEKRQRTEMSCDWCKKKRCKCLRGSSMDACRACSEVGRPCLTTEPRKRRVYGSLSSASGAGGGPTVSTTTTTTTAGAASPTTSTAGTPGRQAQQQQQRSPTAASPPVLESITATVPESASSPAPSASTPTITAMPIGQHPPQQPTPLPLESGARGEELAAAATTTDPRHLLNNPAAELLLPCGTEAVSPKKILLNLHHQQQHQLQQQQQQLLLLQQQQQQRKQSDERFLEDSMGFPRYIGTLGSHSLLDQLWDMMGMKCPPSTAPQQKSNAQSQSQSQLQTSVGQSMRQCDRGARGIDLPPREVADVLVGLFFDKVHCDFPIFHRALFQAHYENMWIASASSTSPKQQRSNSSHPVRQRQQQQQQDQPQQSQTTTTTTTTTTTPPNTDPAWLMCLSMVFVLGLEVFSTVPSSFSPAQSAVRRLLGNASRREELQKKYLAQSQERLPDVLTGAQLVHVQALLLYCRYLHITRNRNACWNLTGVAIRVAFAIGLHRDGGAGGGVFSNGSKCNPLERELRRRVWWTLYAFEAMECSSLGRLSAIDHTACNVGLPSEGVLDMGDTMPLGYVAAQAELMKLLGSICRHQYGGSSHEHHEEEEALVEASAAEMAAASSSSIQTSTNHNGSSSAKSSTAKSSISSSSSSASAMVAHDQVAFAQTMTEALDNWYARLPSHLRLYSNSPRSHARAILLLHIQYHYTVALLYRPFLLAMVTRKTSSSSSSSSSSSTDGAPRWPEADAVAETAALLSSTTTPPPSPSPSSSPVRFFAHNCIRSAKSAVRVLDQLFRAGQFNSKTWWDVYFIEAICMVLAMGRFVDDMELYNDTGIVDSLKTCIRILKGCKEFSPTMQRFAAVTTDFAQSLVTEAAQAQQRQQHQQQQQHQQHHQQQQQQQQQQQLMVEEKPMFTQSPTPQTTPQPLLQDLPMTTQPSAFQADQFQQQLHLQLQMQQSYFESDDLGDLGAASTAASQSVGSPDESFMPIISGHINPSDLSTSGPLMDTTYPFSSVSWNVPELSPFWGDVSQPDHWW